jgi:16S rRNA (guanine(966)-N(2))-methyltransferase RsmD
MDRVKESLFNILGTDVVDARFLDLFAGTGSVGIEALSRGAAHAEFVEHSRKAVATIHRNLRETGLADRATVIRRDVFAFLEMAEGPYDIIFLAPPQYRGLWIETLRALDHRPELLSEEGLIIAQIDPLEYEEVALENLELVDQRVYGSTMLCFYVRK